MPLPAANFGQKPAGSMGTGLLDQRVQPNFATLAQILKDYLKSTGYGLKTFRYVPDMASSYYRIIKVFYHCKNLISEDQLESNNMATDEGEDPTDDIRVRDDEFEKNKEFINQDIANTLDRVINDYANHWKGVIGESIQNSYDAWCTNRFDRGIIPEDQNLAIEIIIDLNAREIVIIDNAGGMPSDNFYNHFAGLDTPGEEKQSGRAGGSYGRGFHVISGAGDETYAETKHGGFHGGLVVRGPYQMRYDELKNLEQQGTRVEVKDVNPDLILKLSDRKRVHDHIKARFQRLLEHNDVTVSVTIDGETEEVIPIDLSQFEVLWEGDIEFEHGGMQKTLKDAIVYRKENEDVPFEGMSMNKRNEHMDQTFMRVKEYRPRRINHLDKMFGFCDASVLCPEYENNAHTGWVGGVLPAGIKSRLEQIEREEFIGGPTEIDQRDTIVKSALEMLSSQWGEDNPFDASTDASELDIDLELGDEETVDTVESEESIGESEQNELPIEDPAKDEDSQSEEIHTDGDHGEEGKVEEVSEPVPVLRCRTKQRAFDSGETVDIRVLVENPKGTNKTDYEVSGELEDEDGDIRALEKKSISVSEGETSGGADGWEFDPNDNNEKFIFRAELHPRGQVDEELDSTHTYFFVGDSVDTETGAPKHTFIENIEFIPDPMDTEFRHELQEGEEALVLLVNPSHPEYRYAEKLDGRNNTKNQIATVVRWGQEAIMNYLLLDRLEDELQDHSLFDDDGNPLDETLTGFVRERLINGLSEFSAQTYEDVS